jgi:hypothetical protein
MITFFQLAESPYHALATTTGKAASAALSSVKVIGASLAMGEDFVMIGIKILFYLLFKYF